jgi:hypothetical protein
MKDAMIAEIATVSGTYVACPMPTKIAPQELNMKMRISRNCCSKARHGAVRSRYVTIGRVRNSM